MTTLQAVGIEDLITEMAHGWLLDGAPSGEPVALLQPLVALAWARINNDATV
jgi:hypothetical protein